MISWTLNHFSSVGAFLCLAPKHWMVPRSHQKRQFSSVSFCWLISIMVLTSHCSLLSFLPGQLPVWRRGPTLARGWRLTSEAQPQWNADHSSDGRNCSKTDSTVSAIHFRWTQRQPTTAIQDWSNESSLYRVSMWKQDEFRTNRELNALFTTRLQISNVENLVQN